MNKFSDEQLRQIIDGAPDGATHYTDKTKSLNLYFKLVHMECMYCWICGKWEVYPPHGNLLSLSDLKENLALRDRVEELEKWSDETLKTIQDNTVEPVCCERPSGYECCGSPEPDWPQWVTEITQPPKENTNERD